MITAANYCCLILKKHSSNIVIRFIEEGRKGNNKVLLHCAAGVSRSSTVVVSYQKRALEEVQLNHPMAFPNMGFREQLQKYQALLNIKE